MKIGRFVVDSHVHAQRHAAGKKLREKTQANENEIASEVGGYSDLSGHMRELVAYDNSPRLKFDMETYDVDMCVLLPAFGMTNEINAEIVANDPDKFVAVCNAKKTLDRAVRGEAEWTIEAACAELDELLSSGKFVGIGEGCPADPTRKTNDRPDRADGPDPCRDAGRAKAQGPDDVPYRRRHGISAHARLLAGNAESALADRHRCRVSRRADGPESWRHAGLAVRKVGRGRALRRRLQRQCGPGDRIVVDRTVRAGADRPEYRPRKADVGHGLGREPADPRTARPPSGDLSGPVPQSRRRHPSGRHVGLEPQAALAPEHPAGRPEPDPRGTAARVYRLPVPHTRLFRPVSPNLVPQPGK